MLDINNIEHILVYVSHLEILFCELYIQILHSLFYWAVCCFLIGCTLCLLYMSPLLDICIAISFSHSVVCLFLVSFDEQFFFFFNNMTIKIKFTHFKVTIWCLLTHAHICNHQPLLQLLGPPTSSLPSSCVLARKNRVPWLLCDLASYLFFLRPWIQARTLNIPSYW